MGERRKEWLEGDRPIKISDQTFTEFLDSINDRPRPEFRPNWHLIMLNSSIDCFWEDVEYYSKPLNEDVELFLANDDNRVVGVKLHGVIGNVPSEQEFKEYLEKHSVQMDMAVKQHQARRKQGNIECGNG